VTNTSRASASESMVVGLVALGVVAVVVLGVLLGYREIDLWGAFAVPGILTALTLPLLGRISWLRSEGLVKIASFALVAKFVGSYLRYLFAFHVYGGNDSLGYHIAGTRIAGQYLAGERSLGSLWPTGTGTVFIQELNGIVALISGRSLIASFMVFSWLSFIGLLCFIAAARRAVPGLRLRGYALAVLFLPSMVFWPSSLGKDAWMVFGMGIAALGIARVLTGAASGAVLLALGGYATAVVRPHVTLLIFAGLAAALIGRQRVAPRRGSGAASVAIATLSVLAVLGFTLTTASQLLPRFDEGVGALLEETERRSSQGGSEIDITSPNSPLEYPFALISVLFRPFLFEVNSVPQAISAVEGTALLAFVVVRRRALFAALKTAAGVPYLRFAGIYVLGFGFAWSSVGNLGIIARQRVQVLPLLLLLFFLMERASHRQDSPAGAPVTTPLRSATR
jgi:hypothetical protein